MVATVAAATPFIAAQMGHPKIAVALGVAVVAGEYIYAQTTIDGTPAQPYTNTEWLTVGIYAAGVAGAFFRPHWALAIGVAVLAIDIYRSGGFGTPPSPPENLQA